MPLENWAQNSWLEKRESDAQEIARLLALADGRLEDYRRAIAGKLSPDVQLGLVYDAIRVCTTVALRAAGYSLKSRRRRNSSQNHHSMSHEEVHGRFVWGDGVSARKRQASCVRERRDHSP